MIKVLATIKKRLTRKKTAEQENIITKMIEAYYEGSEDVRHLIELERMVDLGEDVAVEYMQVNNFLFVLLHEMILLGKISEELGVNTSTLHDKENHILKECIRRIDRKRIFNILKEHNHDPITYKEHTKNKRLLCHNSPN